VLLDGLREVAPGYVRYKVSYCKYGATMVRQPCQNSGLEITKMVHLKQETHAVCICSNCTPCYDARPTSGGDSRRSLPLHTDAMATPLPVHRRGSRHTSGPTRRFPTLRPSSATATAPRCSTGATGDNPNPNLSNLHHAHLPPQHRLGAYPTQQFTCLQARGRHHWEASHMVCYGACKGKRGHFWQTCSQTTCHTPVISHGTYAPAACEGCIAHFQLRGVQVPWQLILALTAGVGAELQSAAKQAAELPASHARHACVCHCQACKCIMLSSAAFDC
jgi:hypothetical protein